MSFPSPNHGERRGGQRPELIVLHYTGMADAASARARLCDSEAEVSAHWLVHENGHAEALVPEDRRAWHAGAGAWQGRDDVNSRSIGIEIVNPGDRPFPARQMRGLEQLLAEIMIRWQIAATSVIGHSDMAPGRKIDPGAKFDWHGLALGGYAVWPDRLGSDIPLEESLHEIGYPDCPRDDLLAAFRLRFRPWASGPEDEIDRRIASAIPRERKL